jgi:hypothetical protein
MVDEVRAAVEKTAAAARQPEVDLNLAYWKETTTGEKLNPDYFVQKFAH